MCTLLFRCFTSFALLAHLLISFALGHVEYVPLDRREAYEYRVGALRRTSLPPLPPVIDHRWQSTSTSSPLKHVWLPEARVYQLERKVVGADDERSGEHWSTTTAPSYDQRQSRKYPQYPPYFEMYIPHDYDLPEYIGNIWKLSCNVHMIFKKR